jgi:hypothetical protein
VHGETFNSMTFSAAPEHLKPLSGGCIEPELVVSQR